MEIRALRASELDQAFDLDADAFHGDPARRETWTRCNDPARIVGAFDGDRLVGMTGTLEFGQFFGGRSVPMGGLSSVAVAPDARGRGIAGRLIRAAIAGMGERGEVISSLYPATTRLYRDFGWEVAGHHVIKKVTLERLRGLPRPGHAGLRPASAGDAPALRACYAQWARGANGCLDRKPHWWERAEIRNRQRDVYVFEGAGGAVEGYLVYRQVDGEWTHLGGQFGLVADELVALTGDAALGLWSLLASWATQAEQLVFRGPADDPVQLLLPEQVFEPLADIRWMTRVVDAPGAVAARGFSPALDLEVPLRLRDAECPANEGSFVLTVQKGEGRLAPSPSAAGPQLDANGFACLYTGWAGTTALARSGRLEGGSAGERAALDAAFAGPMPWMPEEF